MQETGFLTSQNFEQVGDVFVKTTGFKRGDVLTEKIIFEEQNIIFVRNIEQGLKDYYVGDDEIYKTVERLDYDSFLKEFREFQGEVIRAKKEYMDGNK